MREAKNYTEKDGKIYARVTYNDSTGKRRQKCRLVWSKEKVPEMVAKLRREIKTVSGKSKRYADRKTTPASDVASVMTLIPVTGENASSATVTLTFENLESELVKELLAHLKGHSEVKTTLYHCGKSEVVQLQNAAESEQMGKRGLVITLSYRMQHNSMVNIIGKDLSTIAQIMEESLQSLDSKNRLSFYLRKEKRA